MVSVCRPPVRVLATKIVAKVKNVRLEIVSLQQDAEEMRTVETTNFVIFLAANVSPMPSVPQTPIAPTPSFVLATNAVKLQAAMIT